VKNIEEAEAVRCRNNRGKKNEESEREDKDQNSGWKEKSPLSERDIPPFDGESSLSLGGEGKGEGEIEL
jgi:hypothetical protein